jgi:hypothetical protein
MKALVESGDVEKMIDEKLRKMVSDLLDQQLRSYSDFGERIDKLVAEALAIGDFSLPQYGERICVMIQQIVESNVQESFQRSMADRLQQLLIDAPKEVKLSKLCEDFQAQARHYDEPYEKAGESWTLEFVRKYKPGNVLYRHCELRFDEAQDAAKNFDVELRLREVEKDSKRFEVWGLSIDGTDVAKKLFFGPEYGFAKDCWHMYAAKTVIVFDEDPEDICTTFPEHD